MNESISNPGSGEECVSRFGSLDFVFKRPWFAYSTLVLFQIKVLWGIWNYIDLAGGDEASYCRMASSWFRGWHVDILWSPLYTAFYGTFMRLSSDAYAVSIAYRVAIVIVLCVLMLWLMRKLLPPSIAWLVAAWWAVLPINYDSLYAVHLLPVIPLLAIYLVVICNPSPWGRGIAIAILAASMILLRNELSVALLVFSAVCVCWEIRAFKGNHAVSGKSLASLARAYLLPVALAAVLCAFFYSRSIELESRPKHTLNMAQVYAFGYQQRHPEWKKNPWTGYQELMERDFGADLLPLSEMIRRNPRAVLANMWWNICLTPSGIQLMLFNSISGGITPDYLPVKTHSRTALLLSIIVVSIWIAGSILFFKERAYWLDFWLRRRALCWLAMLSVASIAVPVILTQRPRPSYLFSVSILLMAFTGMCLFIISRRIPFSARLSRCMPFIMILAPILVPNCKLGFVRNDSRPVLTLYRRLYPYQKIIGAPGTKFLVISYYGLDVSGYLIDRPVCKNYFGDILDYSILKERPATMPLQDFLKQKGINLFYIDPYLWNDLEKDPVASQFLAAPENAGWTPMGEERNENTRWMLLQRATPE